MAQITQVIFGKRARTGIAKATLFIDEKGYPETAIAFAARLIQFGFSLNAFPDKYPLCRFERYIKGHYRCAVFESNHVFVYKLVKNQLRIYNIIHTKRLK